MEHTIYNFSHDVNTIIRDENNSPKLHYLRTDEYYFVPTTPSILTIQRNGVKKNIRVKADSEFVYSVKKTQVNAKGGPEGLAKFLADKEWRDTAVKVLDAMMDTVKPAVLQPWE